MTESSSETNITRPETDERHIDLTQSETDEPETSSTEHDTETVPETDRPQLQPSDKIVAILLVNSVIFIYYLFVLNFGFSGRADVPDVDLSYAYTTGLTVLLCVLVISSQADFWSEIFGGSGEGQSPFTRILHDDHDNLSRGFRYLITFLTYIGISELILGSGGIRESPFQQFPIALILLAPTIMTGTSEKFSTNSAQQNLLFGLVYVPLLFAFSDWSWWDRVQPIVEPESWVQLVSLLFIVVVSLVLSTAKELRRRSASRAPAA